MKTFHLDFLSQIQREHLSALELLCLQLKFSLTPLSQEKTLIRDGLIATLGQGCGLHQSTFVAHALADSGSRRRCGMRTKIALLTYLSSRHLSSFLLSQQFAQQYTLKSTVPPVALVLLYLVFIRQTDGSGRVFLGG